MLRTSELPSGLLATAKTSKLQSVRAVLLGLTATSIIHARIRGVCFTFFFQNESVIIGWSCSDERKSKVFYKQIKWVFYTYVGRPQLIAFVEKHSK